MDIFWNCTVCNLLSEETYFLQIDNSFGQIKPFTFNEAFGEETSQEEMFEGCGIKHLVEMAVEGLVLEGFTQSL